MFWATLQYNQIDTSNSEGLVATIFFEPEGGGSRFLQNVCTVGHATTYDATTYECYNKQFLSIK
jgi:hypothetical protein